MSPTISKSKILMMSASSEHFKSQKEAGTQSKSRELADAPSMPSGVQLNIIVGETEALNTPGTQGDDLYYKNV